MFRKDEQFRVVSSEDVDQIEINDTAYCLLLSLGYSEKMIIVEGEVICKNISKNDWSVDIYAKHILDLTPNVEGNIEIPLNSTVTIKDRTRHCLFTSKQKLVLYCNKLLTDKLKRSQYDYNEVKRKYDDISREVDRLIDQKKKIDFLLGEFEQGAENDTRS